MAAECIPQPWSGCNYVVIKFLTTLRERSISGKREDGLLAFLGLALAHERSNATKTVTAAREEMAKAVYRGKSANSATRIG